MSNYNRCVLVGHLTRDPELKHTPKGTAVAKLGLAINRNWTTESGEKREEVTFVDVTAFGKQAEVLSQYLRKGRSVLIEGRLNLETWDDKATGQKKSKLGVVMESFSFLGGAAGENKPAETARASAPGPARAAALKPAGVVEQDDIPF